jgi:transcriptional regulator with XRE-family HTH domain
MPQNQRVILLRNFLRLTQKALAEVLMIGPSKINKVESGEQTLNPEMIATIVKNYNVDAEWLLCIKGSDDEILFKKDKIVDETQLDYKSRYFTLLESYSRLQDAKIEKVETENEQLKARERVHPEI